MSAVTIEVPDGERSTMIDALAREALLDLGRLRDQLGELITRANPGEALLADCVSTSRLVTEDLAAFRRIATGGELGASRLRDAAEGGVMARPADVDGEAS